MCEGREGGRICWTLWYKHTWNFLECSGEHVLLLWQQHQLSSHPTELLVCENVMYKVQGLSFWPHANIFLVHTHSWYLP